MAQLVRRQARLADLGCCPVEPCAAGRCGCAGRPRWATVKARSSRARAGQVRRRARRRGTAGWARIAARATSASPRRCRPPLISVAASLDARAGGASGRRAGRAAPRARTSAGRSRRARSDRHAGLARRRASASASTWARGQVAAPRLATIGGSSTPSAGLLGSRRSRTARPRMPRQHAVRLAHRRRRTARRQLSSASQAWMSPCSTRGQLDVAPTRQDVELEHALVARPSGRLEIDLAGQPGLRKLARP